MLMYSIPAFAKGDPTAFLSGVARANQLLKKVCTMTCTHTASFRQLRHIFSFSALDYLKHLTFLSPKQKGELDLTGAARIVLRDWSLGKFSHYTIPPKATDTTPVSAPESTPVKPVNAVLEKVYSKDVSILEDIPTRKEKRKAGGLVRLTAGVADERQVSVEEAWAGLQDSEEEESEEGNDVDDLDEVMSVDEEDDDEAEEDDDEKQPESDEEEEAPPLLSNKQKRKRTLEKLIPERPSKKVAFAPRLPPKNPRSGSKRSGDALVRFTPILSAKHALMIHIGTAGGFSSEACLHSGEETRET